MLLDARWTVTRKILFFILIYSIGISHSYAQVQPAQNRVSLGSPSEFVFESYPNEPLIPVRLLGAVKNAGLYHIPKNMKLTTLLSLAGGTDSEADLGKIVVGNDLAGAPNNVVLNLEDMIETGRNNDYSLNAHDIVLVKNKTPLISNDSFRIISIVSIVLTSILTGVLIKDRIDEK